MATMDTTRIEAMMDEHDAYMAVHQPEASGWGDIPSLGAMAGANLARGVHGVGEYLGSQFGWDDVRQHSAEARRSIDDFYKERFEKLSPATQAAMQKEWATLGPDAAWRDPRSVAASALVNSAYILPTILTGGLAAGGGALAARLAGVAGLATEGTLASGAVYGELAGEIERLADAQLQAQSPRYAELRAQLSEEQAKLQLTNETANAIFPLVFGATMAGGAAGGRAARALTGRLPGAATGTGRLASAGRGFAEEMGQEAVQSGGEALLSNIAAETYDPQRAMTQDLLENIIGGAVTGGALGGVGGAVLRNRPWQPEARGAASTDLTARRDTPSTEGVTDALRSRSEAPARPKPYTAASEAIRRGVGLPPRESAPAPSPDLVPPRSITGSPEQMTLDLTGGQQPTPPLAVPVPPASDQPLMPYDPSFAAEQRRGEPRQLDLLPQEQAEMFPGAVGPTAAQQGAATGYGALYADTPIPQQGAIPQPQQAQELSPQQELEVVRTAIFEVGPQTGRSQQWLRQLYALVVSAYNTNGMAEVGAVLEQVQPEIWAAVVPALDAARQDISYSYELDQPPGVQRAYRQPGAPLPPPEQPLLPFDWPAVQPGGVQPAAEAFPEYGPTRPPRMDRPLTPEQQREVLAPEQMEGAFEEPLNVESYWSPEMQALRAERRAQAEQERAEAVPRQRGVKLEPKEPAEPTPPGAPLPDTPLVRAAESLHSSVYNRVIPRGSQIEADLRWFSALPDQEQFQAVYDRAQQARNAQDEEFWTRLLRRRFRYGRRTRAMETQRQRRKPMTGAEVARSAQRREEVRGTDEPASGQLLRTPTGRLASLFTGRPGRRTLATAMEGRTVESGGLRGEGAVPTLQEADPELFRDIGQMFTALFYTAFNRARAIEVNLAKLESTGRPSKGRIANANRQLQRAKRDAALLGDILYRTVSTDTAEGASGLHAMRGANYPQMVALDTASSIEAAKGVLEHYVPGFFEDMNAAAGRGSHAYLRRSLRDATADAQESLAKSIVNLRNKIDALPEEQREAFTDTTEIEVRDTRRRTWSQQQMYDRIKGREKTPLHYDEVKQFLKQLGTRGSGYKVRVNWQSPVQREGTLYVTRYDILGPEHLQGSFLNRVSAQFADTLTGEEAEKQRRKEAIRQAARREKWRRERGDKPWRHDLSDLGLEGDPDLLFDVDETPAAPPGTPVMTPEDKAAWEEAQAEPTEREKTLAKEREEVEAEATKRETKLEKVKKKRRKRKAAAKPTEVKPPAEMTPPVVDESMPEDTPATENMSDQEISDELAKALEIYERLKAGDSLAILDLSMLGITIEELEAQINAYEQESRAAAAGAAGETADTGARVAGDRRVIPAPTPAGEDGRVRGHGDFIVADRDVLPEPGDDVVAGRPYADILAEHQKTAVNHFIRAFRSGAPAAMLADGAGSGKTMIILAIADIMRNDVDGPVLILTENERIINSRFFDDAQKMGIDRKNIEFGTYAGLLPTKNNPRPKVPNKKYGMVLFDEAHNIKSLKGTKGAKGKRTQAQAGRALQAQHKLFATATPMDNPEGYVYFAGALTGLPRSELFKQLGFRLSENKDGSYTLQPLKDVTPQQRVDRVLEFRRNMVKRGLWMRREEPFKGEVIREDYTPPAEVLDESRRQLEFWDNYPRQSVANQQRPTAGSNWNDIAKAQTGIPARAIKEELDAGRRVVVLAKTVNPSINLRGLGERRGALQIIHDQLLRMGVPDGRIAIAAGPKAQRSNQKEAAVERFQSGEAHVLLGTAQGIGTGLSLDDQVGNAPRTIVYVSPEWSAIPFDQALRRVSRFSTKSQSKVRLLMWDNDTVPQEDRVHARMTNKLDVLHAIQGGQRVDPDVATGQLEEYGASAPSVTEPQPSATPAAASAPTAPRGGSLTESADLMYNPRATPVRTWKGHRRRKTLDKLTNAVRDVAAGRRTTGRHTQEWGRVLRALDASMHWSDPRRLVVKVLRELKIAPILSIAQLPTDILGRYYTDYATASGMRMIANQRIELDESLFDGTRTPEVLQHTLLHELVHAAIMHRLNTDADATQAFKALYTRAVSALNDRGYWTFNVNEFVAEALSNPQLQRRMMTLPASSEGFITHYGKRLLTLWDEFVDWAMRTLGLGRTPQQHSMLSEVMLAFRTYAEDPTKADPIPVQHYTQHYHDTEGGAHYRNPAVRGYWAKRQAAKRARAATPTGSLHTEMANHMDTSTAAAADDMAAVMEAMQTQGRWSGRDLWARTKETGLGSLTLRQLGDIYDKLFAGETNWLKKYVDLNGRRSMMTHELQRVPEQLSNRWMNLNRTDAGQYRAMNDLLLNETVYGVWSDRPFNHEDNNHLESAEERAKWEELNAAYRGLDGTTQQLFSEIRQYFQEDWQRTLDILKENITRVYNITDASVLENMKPPTLPKDKAARKKAHDDWHDALFGSLIPYVRKKGKVNEHDSNAINRIVDQVRHINRTVRLQGPYFPLKRHGDYVVFAERTKEVQVANGDALEQLRTDMWAKDPGIEVTLEQEGRNDEGGGTARVTERWFSTHESLADAERIAEEVGKTQQWSGVTPQVGRKRDMALESDGTSMRFIRQLENSGKLNQAAVNALKAVLIELMPETSVRKQELRRKGIEGYSRDALRSFAGHATSSSYHQAQLKYGSQMKEALVELNKAARVAQATNTGDQINMQQLAHELEKRDQMSATAPWERPFEGAVAALSNTGFVWYLANASYLMVNLTQPWALGLPWLAARYGTAKASSVMRSAVSTVARDTVHGARRDWNKYFLRQASPMDLIDPEMDMQQLVRDSDMFKDSEKDQAIEMLRDLQNRGLIQLTFAADLRGFVAGHGGTGVKATAGKVMDAVRALPQRVEVANRNLMALSAYRLALDATGSHEQAVEQAVEAVWQTQFDYSATNKPRWFQNQIARPLLMFKQHGQHMYVLLIKSVYDMFKGADVETQRVARNQLLGILAAHGLLAGALGMVFEPLKYAIILAGTMFTAVTDEDDYWDYETWVRQGLSDLLGPQMGELIARGPLRAAGVDLASRITLTDMLILDRSTNAQGRQAVMEFLYNAGGPLVAMVGEGLEGALVDWPEGAKLRAVERMVPKLIRDPIQAYRLNAEGVADSRGNVIRGAGQMDPWEFTLKFLGFQPREISELYEGRNAALKAKGFAQRRRDTLIERYRRASPAAQSELWRSEILQFNRTWPEFRITLGSLRRGLTSKRKRELQAERQKGVIMDRKYRRLLEEGRFANL